ncbi:FAD-binding oxidoreductase [Aspergillus undulatus]|uniref:FAD-binding oxidoreductase n=1 Tax=Aspergillus undulatus TaxID=1810928 RepID=UPI003CCD5D2A
MKFFEGPDKALLIAFPLWNLVSASLSPSSSASASAIPVSSFDVELAAPEKCACAKLTYSFGSSMIYPGQTNYTYQTVDSYWDKRAALSPACVFVPESADEVASAVKILGACDAPFAVRGGGHMNYFTDIQVPGSNNINGGVLLGLNKLNTYKLNNNNNNNNKDTTISVGPGLTWYDVYAALSPHGLAAIGGRVKTIGVPGLTLIGGFYYFNNKYGYAMDNVLSYDVVLGNGSQVFASASENRDLFWALKGGGSNFGIVTRFEVKTFEVPRVSTTIQVYDETAIQDFFGAMCDAATLDGDEDIIAAGMVATVSYNVTTKVASASLLGVQEGISFPPSQFVNFTTIPALQRIHNVTTMKEWSETLETPKQMFRIMFSHKTITPDPDALLFIYKEWKAAVDSIADVQGLQPTFVLNHITPSSLRVAKENKIGNVWGLEDEPLMIWQFSTSWSRAQDDERMETWSRELTERLHAMNQEKGIASEFVYMGDAGEWQDAFAGLPEGNLERLKSVRERYDSDHVLSRLNWGGFKLGE